MRGSRREDCRSQRGSVRNLLHLKMRPSLTRLLYPAILFGKHILVVDDDIRNVYSLTIALEKEGIDVLTANNGEEALQLMESRLDIDLVLMDIMMPVMDGYEAMRQIRQHPEYHSVPVIALTAKAMMQDRELVPESRSFRLYQQAAEYSSALFAAGSMAAEEEGIKLG